MGRGTGLIRINDAEEEICPGGAAPVVTLTPSGPARRHLAFVGEQRELTKAGAGRSCEREKIDQRRKAAKERVSHGSGDVATLARTRYDDSEPNRLRDD